MQIGVRRAVFALAIGSMAAAWACSSSDSGSPGGGSPDASTDGPGTEPDAGPPPLGYAYLYL
ncbi:MAG TPA: hypothetical protein VNO21_24455, partial [Polyangiaceae bacterium]|nr:hypothetical protein [Polyangiaceae bacterium]